jgi:hypothetical protein
MVYESIALKLHLSPQELERESVRLFLSTGCAWSNRNSWVRRASTACRPSPNSTSWCRAVKSTRPKPLRTTSSLITWKQNVTRCLIH